MVLFSFSVSDRKYTFWENLMKKFKNLSWCINLVPTLTQSMQNSLVAFAFSVFDWQWTTWVTEIWFLGYFKYAEFNVVLRGFCFEWKLLFLANFFQTITIISLSWNLVPRLVLYQNIDDGIQFLLFCREIHFWVKFDPKKSKLLV